MAQAKNDQVVLEYDTFGNPSDPALLLIMGYTAQMIAWPEDFCHGLAGAGHYVVRFDNRDCGLSSKTDGDAPEMMSIVMAAMSGSGATLDVPYSLSDMASDAIAVLDAVGVDRAHLVGASMGGMIAQTTAIEHPTRVASLTSVMSSTGAADAGQAKPEAMAALMTVPPADRDGAIERGVEVGRIIGGPLFDEDLVREAMAASYDRSFYPEGATFQLAAIAKTGDRTARLGALDVPTLVVHGACDSLITPSGGEATAAAVPNATLLMLDDMGHDLPRPLWDQIIGAISDLALGA